MLPNIFGLIGRYRNELLLCALSLVLVRGCQLRDREIDQRATAEWRLRSADSLVSVYKDSLEYANKVLAVKVSTVGLWHVDTLWRSRSNIITTHDTTYVLVPQAVADSIVREQNACEELKGTCALLQRSAMNTIQGLRDENAALKARPERSCLAPAGISAAVAAAGALWLVRR